MAHAVSRPMPVHAGMRGRSDARTIEYVVDVMMNQFYLMARDDQGSAFSIGSFPDYPAAQRASEEHYGREVNWPPTPPGPTIGYATLAKGASDTPVVVWINVPPPRHFVTFVHEAQGFATRMGTTHWMPCTKRPDGAINGTVPQWVGGLILPE